MSERSKAQRWLVDGSNVVGSRPDGWWRDRPAAFARLAGSLGEFAARTGDEVTVVFDGRPGHPVGTDLLTVGYAPSADDRLVELAQLDAHPGTRTAVTSDRALADRLRQVGTPIIGSGTFRRLVDETVTS